LAAALTKRDRNSSDPIAVARPSMRMKNAD
jgi:hypothetical protein